jgi:hypothetical protein
MNVEPMNPLTVNPVIVLQDSRSTRRRERRDRALYAARSARYALERIVRL